VQGEQFILDKKLLKAGISDEIYQPDDNPNDIIN